MSTERGRSLAQIAEACRLRDGPVCIACLAPLTGIPVGDKWPGVYLCLACRAKPKAMRRVRDYWAKCRAADAAEVTP